MFISFSSFTKILNKISIKKYTTEIIGEGISKRIYLLDDKKNRISFWNDLRLKSNKQSGFIQLLYIMI